MGKWRGVTAAQHKNKVLLLPTVIKPNLDHFKLGERGFQISLMTCWINRFDLIYQLNVLEIDDRGQSVMIHDCSCSIEQ